jgi:predicted acetyltransferase
MNNNMDVRILSKQERELSIALWQYCFNDDLSFTEWYYRRRAGDILALMDENELIAQIVCVPLSLSLRGTPRNATLLSGVATAPVHRGRGHMTTLMRDGLAYLRESGCDIASLYPYDYGFYHQYANVEGISQVKVLDKTARNQQMYSKI